MNRVGVFGIILAASTIGFVASFYLLSVNYQAQSTETNMSDIMRRMMGGVSPMAQPGSAEPSLYMLILPPVFIATLIVGVIGFVYFLMVPEIKLSKTTATIEVSPPAEALQQDRFATLVKTMRPDEAKVFDALVSHGGKYLQKHISKEAGLSRLKTHRIIARFAERGIVTVRPFGNTNEVALSEWLTSEDDLEKRVGSP